MSPLDPGVTLLQATSDGDVGTELREALIGCWIAVSNAGGAAGFPFPPVDVPDVAPVVDDLVSGSDAERSRLIIAMEGETLAGWVNLHRDTSPLVAHWGTIRHLQTHPRFRRRGIGAALMRQAQVIAREQLGLSQLHLAVRGGMGLEEFYDRLGWREVGRWPNALRLADGDDRDEVLMLLDPL